MKINFNRKKSYLIYIIFFTIIILIIYLQGYFTLEDQKSKQKKIIINSQNLNKYLNYNSNGIFCFFIDSNVQINIRVEKSFNLTGIALVNENVYFLADKNIGFKKLKLNKNYNYNIVSLNFVKNELKFESKKIGLSIRLKRNNDFEIEIFKLVSSNSSIKLLGLIYLGLVKNSFSFSQRRKIASNWKIKDGDIFSHNSKNHLLHKIYKKVNIKCESDKIINFRISGSIFSHNSFALVNRNIILNLYKSNQINILIDPIEKDLRNTLNPTFDILLVYSLYKKQKMKQSKRKLIYLNSFDMNKIDNFKRENNVIYVHQWSWEFHAIPIKYTNYFNKYPDEIWTPCEYNRQLFAKNGVNIKKLQVIPHGINLNDYKTDSNIKFKLNTNKKFKFLTIAGMLPRKGIDLILKSYVSIFTSQDNVTLIIHSIYTLKDDYESKIKNILKQLMLNKNTPEIILLQRPLTDTEIIQLLRSVDVYLSPYRSEGFGLTILEAMAVGLPSIVTNFGPVPEFCSDKCCFFVEAVETDCFIHPCGNMTAFSMKTLFQTKWSEPNLYSLKILMKKIFNNFKELSKRKLACQLNAEKYTWDKATEKIIKRVHHLIKLKS